MIQRMLPTLIAAFVIGALQAEAATPQKIRVLYNSLNPNSVSQHLAFYRLYSNSAEGKQALRDVWKLLSPSDRTTGRERAPFPLAMPAIEAIISLVNKQPDVEIRLLNDQELQAINKLAEKLPNRHLKGHIAAAEAEVMALPSEEIDLARGLFLSQMGSDPEAMQKLRSYEAMIDLMALQILARIPLDASPRVKISEMNHFIFEEMGFRFPPHSLYAKDVDLYTFLPSVLDSRRGVCLGVSILYLCLAQRLDLSLETITPPGHIYIRYRDPLDNSIINIETTARGVNMECEVYLSVGTRSLEQRDIKEVIGMAHFNEASVYLHREEYDKALDCYQKAEKYMPQDKLLKELMGYCNVVAGQKDKGTTLLEEIKDHLPDHAVSKDLLAEDYLLGKVDDEGIKAVLMHVNEKRESILKKKEKLEEVLKKHPNFRSGYFTLATTWLQLHRLGEALEALKHYHALYPSDPTAEYYLSMVYAERLNYSKAWEHLNNSEALVKLRGHKPKALKDLRKELALLCPE